MGEHEDTVNKVEMCMHAWWWQSVHMHGGGGGPGRVSKVERVGERASECVSA